MTASAIPSTNVRFTKADCAVLGEFDTRVKWAVVTETSKAARQSIRQRVDTMARLVQATYSGGVAVTSKTSQTTPNGRAALDYWSCVYPQVVPNKSFGFQIAFIVSSRGGEMCFCLGAETSQEQNVENQRQNQRALRNAKERLKTVPPALLQAISARLDADWLYRAQWRLLPGSDFDTLEEWVAYAASPLGAGASVSKYYTRDELENRGEQIVDDFRLTAEIFAPLMDFIYADDAPSLPIVPVEPRQRPPKTWCVATGEGGSMWPEFADHSLIAIGARGLRQDLRAFATKEDIALALAPLTTDGSYPTNEALCCFEFSREMQPGDFVLAKRGMSDIVAYGRVAGEYQFDPSRAQYPHIRPVEWLQKGSWHLPDSLRVPVKTLTDVSGFQELLRFMEPLLATEQQEIATAAPLYTIDEAIEDLFIDRKQFAAMRDRLARKKNLIIEGPPGVGKTFFARRLALLLIGRADQTRIQMVQFHQSYAYEDFIRGWRPNDRGGFTLEDGVFYRFCQRAAANPDTPYVFIIDEINRGNLSKIFGEVMMLIEADKRNASYAVPLTYPRSGAETFFISPNVHVIGLMNTADRSLAMVDYALRRRFSFLRVQPAFQSGQFREYLIRRGAEARLVDRIVDRLSALNDTIGGDSKSLGEGFVIGHSYFCLHGPEATLDDSWYESIIVSEIQPLLNEYWPEQPKKVRDLVQQLLA